jgi:hypothetical protein
MDLGRLACAGVADYASGIYGPLEGSASPAVGMDRQPPAPPTGGVRNVVPFNNFLYTFEGSKLMMSKFDLLKQAFSEPREVEFSVGLYNNAQDRR